MTSLSFLLSALVIRPVRLGLVDVALLTLFRPIGKEDANILSHGFHIAKITRLDPGNGTTHFQGSTGIKSIEP